MALFIPTNKYKNIILDMDGTILDHFQLTINGLPQPIGRPYLDIAAWAPLAPLPGFISS